MPLRAVDERSGRVHFGPLSLEPAPVNAIHGRSQNKDGVSTGSGVEPSTIRRKKRMRASGVSRARYTSSFQRPTGR